MITFRSVASGSNRSRITCCDRRQASWYDVVGSTTAGPSSTVPAPQRGRLGRGRSHPGEVGTDGGATSAGGGNPPVVGVHHRVNRQSRLLRCVGDLVRVIAIRDCLHFDGVEPGLARQREAVG